MSNSGKLAQALRLASQSLALLAEFVQTPNTPTIVPVVDELTRRRCIAALRAKGIKV